MGKDWVIAYYDIGKLAYSEPRKLSDTYTFEHLEAEFLSAQLQTRDGFFCYLVEGTVAPLTVRDARAAELAWRNRLAREGLEVFKQQRLESNRFPISVVLSVMNQLNLDPGGFGSSMALCEFMVGGADDVRDLQVRRFCADELRRQFPGVASIDVPGSAAGSWDHVAAFMAEVEGRYGTTCKVERVSYDRLMEFRSQLLEARQ